MILGAHNPRDPGQEELLNTPKLTQHVQDGHIPEPKRWEALEITTQKQDQTIMKAPDNEEGQERKGRSTKRCVRFAKDLLHCKRLDTKEEGVVARGRLRVRHPTPCPKRKPSQTPAPRGKGVPTNMEHVDNDVAESWDDYAVDSDGDGDDDNYNDDVIMERHPLGDYPRIDESSFLRREIVTPARAGSSLLTKGLWRYAAILEVDSGLAVEIQEAVRCQGSLSRLQEKKLQRLSKIAARTSFQPHMKEGVPTWKFELSENGLAAGTIISHPIVPVYVMAENVKKDAVKRQHQREEEPKP
ncbi:hypothetical protein GQX73_g3120 [Xylaria multiplex]|uniref:Uncharacterized protein n=1 Tax=Xylaria multiplex TaxID=323545 RepID=A0A7C8IXW8_9PEZI|nr:hypothetical protein GQX73_g3120 [Xylaria multiplex]